MPRKYSLYSSLGSPGLAQFEATLKPVLLVRISPSCPSRSVSSTPEVFVGVFFFNELNLKLLLWFLLA